MKNFLIAVKLKLDTVTSNLNKYRRDDPLAVTITSEVKKDKLWLTFGSENQSQNVCLNVPYLDEYSNCVVGSRVRRAVGTWNFQETEYTYWRLMTFILTGRIDEVFAYVGKKSQLERLLVSFDTKTAPLAARSFQNLVDNVVNELPLIGTPMETWAMCNRVVFLDPAFKTLSPKEALDYQKDLNIKYFPWTSVGLSDSGMCNNNLLKQDLRKFTPFGVKHHNPMRNLYQTLGMRGAEEPLIVTESMSKLKKDTGIERRGWNLMTCYLDTPFNFEDQLIVDSRHMDKFTLESKRFVCFGDVLVSSGEELDTGCPISIEPNGKALSFWNNADRAVVTEIKDDVILFNGQERKVKIVYVETKHIFKEGIKVTNCHGNKGVVAFADCGTMYDAGRGVEVPIDIIVSAKTIGKRKNYGQVLEVLQTLVRGKDNHMVVADDCTVETPKLKEYLTSKGYSSDGTSKVTTQWFSGNAICGWGFWGLIKNPESQLWTKSDVTSTDNRGRRTAGVKISHIEFKGLTTIFGPKNPVIDEILSHQQGFDGVCELLEVLEALRGDVKTKPVLDWSAVKPLSQGVSYFHTVNEVKGTIMDPNLMKDGFMLSLPVLYHVFTPSKSSEEVEYEILNLDTVDLHTYAKPNGRNVFLNKVYIPKAEIRECWQHTTGLWGLSDIGGHLNNVVTACYNLSTGDIEPEVLLRTLNRYIFHVSRRLSTKSGEISTYALAVRYPHSVKATATLAKQGLPTNWIEIHKDMAADLGVRDGDCVIAERFPCLGFKSLRIQRVRVTDDVQCKYVIRVSGNSLVSQNLDFDGDVLFLMSFRTEEANSLLQQEFATPNATRMQYILESNATKVPCVSTTTLDAINIKTFNVLTPQRQADIVGSLTGLKRGTGAIVALSYNVMRIIENNVGFRDKEVNLALELIMDKVANSVFGQKHDGVSLEDRCKEAICTANLNDMLDMGFPVVGSQKLCEIIQREAESLGVQDLEKHFARHIEEGKSNIVNVIIRQKHKFYFATRSLLDPMRLLQHIETDPTDLTSHLWSRNLRIKETHDLSTL